MNDDMRFVRSIDRAIDILLLLSESDVPLTLHTIAMKLDSPKSTMLNILRTLVRRDLVRLDESSKTYRLGHLLATLARKANRDILITVGVLQEMENLANVTGEVVCLIAPQGDETTILEMVRAPQIIQYNASVGERRPLYCTSPGKLALAMLAPRDLDDYLKRTPLHAFTEHTITSATALRKELEQIRGQGYAISDGEYELDLYGVSAAVFRDTDRSYAAALTVAGSTLRMRAKIHDILPLLQQAAAKLDDGASR